MIVTPKSLLLPYQLRWANDKSRWKIGCWARQTGKDFSSAEEIAEDMIERPKTEWMIAAPSERQSLESLDKVKTWFQAFGIAFEDSDIYIPEAKYTASCIKYANGAKCIAVPGKPSTVRGFSANLLLTEFAHFEEPDATWAAIIPTITNKLKGGEKRVRIISTPNGKTGQGARFWKILRDNYFEPDKKTRWSVHFNTLKSAIAEGLPVDYDELCEEIGDAATVAQELDLEFIDSSNQLLPYDVISLAESALASETCDPEIWQQAGHDIRLGIDFGRTNDPTVCWATKRDGSDTWTTIEVLVLQSMNTLDQLNALRTRINACTRCCFDYTGPGIGLGDILAREFGEYKPSAHQFGKVELCTFTSQFKRLIFPRMRQAFAPPVRLRIPLSQTIREDLASMQQVVINGDYSYDAPRTKAGHSDRCTALALNWRASEGAGYIPMPVPFYR